MESAARAGELRNRDGSIPGFEGAWVLQESAYGQNVPIEFVFRGLAQLGFRRQLDRRVRFDDRVRTAEDDLRRLNLPGLLVGDPHEAPDRRRTKASDRESPR
jgi:hypothetical protein